MLLNLFAGPKTFNCGNLVFDLLGLCLSSLLYLFTLLINDAKARANELILKKWYSVLHSKVNIRVQLKQQVSNALSNFLIQTIYCYLP